MNTDRILKVIGEILSDRFDCRVTVKGLKGDKKNEEKDREVPYGSRIYGDHDIRMRGGRQTLVLDPNVGHWEHGSDDSWTETVRPEHG